MDAVLALSGGLDSTTVLAWLLDKGKVVLPVIFKYPSKHNPYEYGAALEVCLAYDLQPLQMDLTTIFQHLESDLLKSGGEIPEGHYSDESMKATVVPGRNIIFLSILAGIAMSRGARTVAIGVHQGDHPIYPDCRPAFIGSMYGAIWHGSDEQVLLEAPFRKLSKIGIVKWGLEHEVPYHLTRTCYKDQVVACGKCGSCVERLEAFRENEAEDPINYE